MLTRKASLTNFWTIGVLLGALIRPFYEQMKSFWNPKNSKHSNYRVQNAFLPVVSNWMAYYLTFETKTGHFKPSDDLFMSQKAGFGTAWGPKRA